MNKRAVAPVLALDIGNVAIRINPLTLLNHMGFESMEAFRAFDCDQAIWNGCMAYENGEMTTEAFSEWFVSVVPKPLMVEDVPHIWGSLVDEEINGIAEVVTWAVDHGIQPVFMSDICPLRYELCRDLLSFMPHMAGAVLSYEVGQHKPHDDMYYAMESRYCEGGVPLLYADDLPQNIEAAVNRGWSAYQFGAASELHRQLVQRFEEYC